MQFAAVRVSFAFIWNVKCSLLRENDWEKFL